MEKENKIRLLPEIVANQIAAGEVVDNPSSVVKEMAENAVDAGASLVTINFRADGRELVQVTDNGEHLRFSVDSFSPFAIVVDTSAAGSDSPETGVTVDTIYVYAIVMGVAAAALVVVAFVSKKKKA